MFSYKAPRLLVAALAGSLLIGGYPARSLAQESAETRALKDQLQQMQQKIDDLTKQINAVAQKQAQAPAGPAAPAAPAAKPAAPAEPKFDAFIKGFYGTLDVSFDDTTKGIEGLTAYHADLIDPTNPNSGFVTNPTVHAPPVGRTGWMTALSTNSSKIGYKGSHKIDDTTLDFIYQIEAGIAITSAPGANTGYTRQANVTKAGIGYGDTFIGLAGKSWGAVKFGTTYAPYKKAVDRLNPFSGQLGDMHVVMGNSGGDNRVEFGTRLDHSIWYESPKLGGMFNFDVLWSPGQNRTYNNVVQSEGSPDCNGGNVPGSGNLLLNCDDGGFSDAFSTDLRFEIDGFYATAAFEWHKDVNRNSDGIGSNSPIYGYYFSNPNAPNNPLDFATFNGIVGEFPGYAAVASPPYLNDIGNEYAIQVGAQYRFDFGLTIDGIYEWLRRNLPANLEWQNERSRNGYFLAVTQTVTERGLVGVGWAHAAKTPGDPGGQHNYNPATGIANTADMYTVMFKWQLDKSLYWYIDAAETFNHGNAHYDLGAGGRGLTTDCHDGTNTVFVDYSSAGPTTWGGCHIQGISTGLNFKF
jgi:predicted porin